MALFAFAGFKMGISSEGKAAQDARLFARANEVGERFS
jgi:hypothetical protein